MKQICVVLALIFTSVGLVFCAEGLWRNLTEVELSKDAFASYYKWRGPSTAAERNDSVLLTASYISQSPCKTLAIRDNCFSHNPKRATELLSRTFETSSLMNPTDALEALKNQYITFVGDSTVMSSYASFVCYLSSSVEMDYDILWQYKDDFLVSDKHKQDKCPHHPSCHIISSVVTITSHNLTLYYHQLNVNRGKDRKRFLSMAERIDVPTIVVINFGLHYHHAKALGAELQLFHNDLATLLRRQRAGGKLEAQWLWLESFPQHFPTADGTGGTYDPETSYRLNTSLTGIACAPVASLQQSHANDWRNRLLDQHLPEFTAQHVVRIADALYSQHDAHVDYGDSFRPELHMDCTHFCTGSGVFRFVIERVLTAVLKCVADGCPLQL